MRALPQLPSPTGTALVDPRTVLSPVQNRMRPDRSSNRLYPWMLIASTTLAGIFCFLYLTKPVIVSAPPAPVQPLAALPQPQQPKSTAAPVAKSDTRVSPNLQNLPGEASRPELSDPRSLSSGNPNPYEETNLRVQHVLGAQGPAGEDLGRIILDVPVLYRSRSLRWTPQEVSRARQLMAGIANYQEKSRMLREEGTQLMTAWNELIGSSIPAETLRADSPTLPANQRSGSAGTGNLDTVHAIQIDR